MVIKKYRANTLEEASQLVQSELGPDAIILTAQHLRETGIKALFTAPRVEVTAAIEEEELEKFQAASLVDKKNDFATTQEAAYTLNSSYIAECIDKIDISHNASLQKKKDKQQFLPEQEKSEYAESIFKLTQNLISQFGETEETQLAPTHATNVCLEESDKKIQTDIVPSKLIQQSDIDLLRDLIRKEIKTQQPEPSIPLGQYPASNQSNQHKDADFVYQFLKNKGIKCSIAQEISRKLNSCSQNSLMGKSEKIKKMKEELEALITTDSGIELQLYGSARAAIIGSAGVGKSLTAAKLAINYLNSKKQVAVIQFNPFQESSQDYLKSLLSSHSIPVSYAQSKEELQKELLNHRHKDLILIDTAGINPYDWKKITVLQDIFQEVGIDQNYLAISATTKDIDIYGAVEQFKALKIKGFIVTKLDETVVHGNIFNLCYVTKIPLAYTTNGKDLGQDLHFADPRELSKSLLLNHNDASVKKLIDMME